MKIYSQKNILHFTFREFNSGDKFLYIIFIKQVVKSSEALTKEKNC